MAIGKRKGSIAKAGKRSTEGEKNEALSVAATRPVQKTTKKPLKQKDGGKKRKAGEVKESKREAVHEEEEKEIEEEEEEEELLFPVDAAVSEDEEDGEEEDEEESEYSGLESEADTDEEDIESAIERAGQSEEEEEDSEEEDDDETNENTVALNSNNRPTKLFNEIVPDTDSDSDSEDEVHVRNTVGRIPLEWYDDYDHIGYNLEGEKIMKPESGDQLDEFLKKMDDPNYWKTFKNESTGEDVVLGDEELQLIQRIQGGQFPNSQYDPYEKSVDFFTHEKMIHPLNNAPEPKRRFLPSVWEHKRVMKIVRAIKKGWIKPKDVKKAPEFYMLWGNDDEVKKDNPMHIAAPKMKLPGHAESYNPPEEYLPSQQEIEEWENLDPESRPTNFLPKKFSNLRSVPGYNNFVYERFERCLDLYLCPRARKVRMNVDPDSLIPKLPKPKDLQPFPTAQMIMYEGHTDIVRCMALDPTGKWLASGSNDNSLRIWEVSTGRCAKVFKFESPVVTLAWNPSALVDVLAVGCGSTLYIMSTGVCSKEVEENTKKTFEQCLPHLANNNGDKIAVDWYSATEEQKASNIRISIKHKKHIKTIVWHHKGDYFASLCADSSSSMVFIHQLLKCRSQSPFKKSKGLVQKVMFHPNRPFFFVATQRYVRVYNLTKQQLVKKLTTGAKWISSIDIHPKGDNLIVGTYDKRLCWFDMDLSTKPYKTLRYHKMAIRQVTYHKKFPLFASCSDDGNVHVFHGMVYNDLMQNPLIVPVKVLKAVEGTGNKLGVLDCMFHHTQPWLFSAGSDATIRMYT
eukprot:Nk52_evm34s293 gene=Nk52_evmTU34s293